MKTNLKTGDERSLLESSGDGVKGMNTSARIEKESELIAAILIGETQLYHQLIRPYERSVYMMSLCYVKNDADAEDVAQEAFIRAFRNLAAFRGESKFSTWLISIALNEARSRLRRQAAIRIVSLDELQGHDELRGAERPISSAFASDWRELPFALVEREEIRNILRRAVERLPDIYKQVLLLRDVEEFNVNETAQILDISTSLVKVRLHRARMMLQKLLAPQLKKQTKLRYATVSAGASRP